MQWRRVRSLYWAQVVEARLLDLERAVKANFNPNQPRVPAGNPDGGQWTRVGGGASSGGTEDARVAQARRSGRGTGSEPEGTPAQQARRDVAEARARAAIRRVNEIDPSWRPRESLTDPNSIEGQIARAEAQRQEAEARLRELARQNPIDLMDAYRRQQGMDLFGEPIWSREHNSVAICNVDGSPFLGVNSEALTYTDGDNARAEQLRDVLLTSYPTSMTTRNIGQIPNNALFHAETTCLLRAAHGSGGTLSGKVIEVHVDREMCLSCEKILPLIGLELGNPKVTFIDPHGRIRTMRDGRWIK